MRRRSAISAPLQDHAARRASRIGLAGWTLLVLLVAALTWDRIAAVRAGNGWILHTEEVLRVIKQLEVAERDVEIGQRTYLLTGKDAARAAAARAASDTGALQATLRELTRDNPAQQLRLDGLEGLMRQDLDLAARTIEARRTQGFDAALLLLRNGNDYRNPHRLDEALMALTEAEHRLLDRRLAQNARREGWLAAFALLGIGLVLLAISWAARLLNLASAEAMRLERQQSLLAQRLRASLESLSQGVAVFDSEHRLTNANSRLHGLLRLPPEALAPGQPYAALTGAIGNGVRLETEAQIAGSGPQAFGEAITYETTSDDGRHLELRRTAMEDGGFVLTISDMTRRIQSEAALREAQKMQAIGQLTGGIAHDFNNLLTVILGNLEFTQRKLPAEDALQSRLERALWATRRGAELTSQLLAFARKQPLAPQALDLSGSVPALVPMLQRSLGETIAVRCVVPEGLWPAMADAARLESALLNLALNGRDAMSDGGQLTLELANATVEPGAPANEAELAPGDYVTVTVSDSGSGMPPEVLARAAEPFFTTKPDGKGTGLGLPMVFGFVKQSRGGLKIVSQPGAGTSIRLYLPRATRPVRAETVRPPQAPGGPKDIRILVLEDEAAVREVAASILREDGYVVQEACDGEEALLWLGQEGCGVDLLLSDVVLPGSLGGREVAARARAIQPRLRVLFMSGYTRDAMLHEGRLEDGVQLIGKPFTQEQLVSRVADLLEEPSAG